MTTAKQLRIMATGSDHATKKKNEGLSYYNNAARDLTVTFGRGHLSPSHSFIHSSFTLTLTEFN